MRIASDRELDAFSNWLTERGLARESRVRFFVGWVNRFVRFRATRSAETWQQSMNVFLQDLTAGATKDWQVRQAGEAITLFCGQFCVSKETRVGGKPHTDTPGLSPDDALNEMQSLLRLRHYSPRTEGSYLGWARRVLACRQRAGNIQPTATDVRN